MNTSEFWHSLDAVFGSVLGRSLASDLYLPALGATATQAMEAGVDPDDVWAELVIESGAPEEARWFHRMDMKQRQRFIDARKAQ